MSGEQKHSSIRINKYSLLAYVYFFFNAVGLPFGLLYTHLLSPVFYTWLLLKKRRPLLLGFLCVMIPYALIHLYLGVDVPSFIKSNLLIASTYIFIISFAYFVNHYPKLGVIFKHILVANFIMTLLAMVIFFTPYREWLWYIKKFTAGVEDLPRLALMTYEASYYSLMFVPIAFYYLLKVFFRQNRTSAFFLLIMVLLPLVLSMSVGVLAAMVLAFLGMYLLHGDKVLRRKSFFFPLFFGTGIVVVITLILLVLFPGNPLFVRLANIFTGYDSSAAGRTFDSFELGYRIAREKSLLFGAGPGQVKILGPPITNVHFWYWGKLDVVRIPNTIGETLAVFGFTGLLVRFTLIAWFFLKTNPFSNYYRTLLFLFIFIYQFTGSFTTNIVEYVIWVLAFSPVFPEFDTEKPIISKSEGKEVRT